MRSATSCSKTLIRSDWRRFWPAPFLYAFLSFFIMPVGLWNTGSSAFYYANSETEISIPGAWRLAEHVYDTLPGFAVINLFLGVALAMVLFGYLMKANSVGLMHALPVNRSRQFLAHFGAGLSMLTAANVLTVALSLLVEIMLGAVDVVPLLIWLLVTELVGFFFLSFGSLCAMATGWLLAVPVIYFGLNFTVLAYNKLLTTLAGLFLRGVGTSRFFRYGSAVAWLTPILKLGEDALDCVDLTMEAYRKGATLFTVNPQALPTVLIYTAVGVLMLLFALVLYRARHSETAGDAIVFPWLRPVVRYVVAGAAGLGLGIVAYEILHQYARESLPLMLGCQLVMGTLAYCAVEMLLRKSYRIFDRRTLLGLAALWLALIALCVGIKTDVLGVQRRVPQADQVETVEFNVGYQERLETDDPSVIEGAVALHKALTKADIRDGSSYFGVTYRLKNGSTLERTYPIDDSDPAVSKALTDLVNLEPLRQNAVVPDYGKWGETFTGGFVSIFNTDREIILSEEQCLALYRALEKDMETPRTPASLWSGDVIDCRLDLNTTEGTYNIWQLRREYTNALALLAEYGVLDPARDWAN